MSVPSETSRVTYTGNAVTVAFSTGFYFQRSNQLAVKLTPALGTETVLTEGVHYTVTLPTTVGGAGIVDMATAPDVGDTLVIERDVPFTQETSFRTQGQFSPAVHEDAMDRIVFQVQEVARRVSDLESAGAPGSVVAGDGLYFSGSNLHVGAGDGIVANADNVAVLYGETGDMLPSSAGAPDGGDSLAVSRANHQHQVRSAAPSVPLAVGAAADAGVADTMLRSDATFDIPTQAPADVDASAAVTGASGKFSDAAHKHQVLTAAAVELTDSTNGAGVATTLAASDHTHSHGARAGGALHALATTAAAGFMSAADKAKLDALAQENIVNGTVQTTDATPTKLVSWTPDDGTAEVFEVLIVAKKTGSAEGAAYKLNGGVRRNGGTAFVAGAPGAPFAYEDVVAWAVSVAIASPAVNVLVTGASATTIDWSCIVRRVVAP